MDERQNDLAMEDLEPQAAPEVPELSEDSAAPIADANLAPETDAAPGEAYPYIHEAPTADGEEEPFRPESYTAPIVNADCAPEHMEVPAEENACMPADCTDPAEENTYALPECETPAEVSYGSSDECASEAPAKPKKKLNKKLLLGGIAAAAVIALVIVLVSLLGGKPKNYGIYIKDGEITMYLQGMDEPVELSSRLMKGADNRDFISYQYTLANLVAVRDNGNLVIYPDKYTYREGATLYMCNPNKPKQDPEKIDSGISDMRVSEDGRTILYYRTEKRTLHVYDLKKEEELFKAKNVTDYSANDALTKVCYRDADGDIFLWAAGADDIRVAKDSSLYKYYPETDVLFVLTKDGELLRKTAETEEAEEIADGVSRIAASYSSGEVYYIRESVVERKLSDYFDDDMAADDAAMTQPKKPSYPTAPKKPYYWNYDVYADYEADLAEYNELYAKYQEEYKKLKAEYEEAVNAYNAKLLRDGVRDRIDTAITNSEYALYYFGGTEEMLISDCVTSQYVESAATDTAVVAYFAYVPQTVERPKMSEAAIENRWAVYDSITSNLTNALYGQTQLYVTLGAESTAVEHKDASDVIVSGDGTAVYFLDAPFAAFTGGKYTATSSNSYAAEAPAADYPAAEDPADGKEEAAEALIPADQREYASLYRITVADGAVGAPELLDSEVSYVFTPVAVGTGVDIFYYKDVDGGNKAGTLYRNGVLLAEDVYCTSGFTVNDNQLLFYTSWDRTDYCGTLCALNLAEENAEVIEISDDVRGYQVTETGDVLFLQNYDTDDHEGTLMLFNVKKGEAVEVDDDVVCVLATH